MRTGQFYLIAAVVWLTNAVGLREPNHSVGVQKPAHTVRPFRPDETAVLIQERASMSRTKSVLAVAVAAGILAAGLAFTQVPSTLAKDVAVAASDKAAARKKAAEERAMKRKKAAEERAAKKKAAAEARAAKKKAAAEARAAKKKAAAEKAAMKKKKKEEKK